MAGEYCRWATCGNCGRCDTELKFHFLCLWCGEQTEEEEGADYWPYCSSLCVARAEADSLEDQP